MRAPFRISRSSDLNSNFALVQFHCAVLDFVSPLTGLSPDEYLVPELTRCGLAQADLFNNSFLCWIIGVRAFDFPDFHRLKNIGSKEPIEGRAFKSTFAFSLGSYLVSLNSFAMVCATLGLVLTAIPIVRSHARSPKSVVRIHIGLKPRRM